jgi:hypothetical protein
MSVMIGTCLDVEDTGGIDRRGTEAVRPMTRSVGVGAASAFRFSDVNRWLGSFVGVGSCLRFSP